MEKLQRNRNVRIDAKTYTTMKLKELKKHYEKVYYEYIEFFSKKQKLDFNQWATGKLGYVCFFGDFSYSFSFSDIVLDINTNQKKGTIIKWYDDYLRGKRISYESYLMELSVEKIKQKNNEHCKRKIRKQNRKRNCSTSQNKRCTGVENRLGK